MCSSPNVPFVRSLETKNQEGRKESSKTYQDPGLVLGYTVHLLEISLYFPQARTINVGCRYNAA